MNLTLPGGERSGTVTVPSSKSCAHRLLIASALADRSSLLKIDGLSDDLRATLRCLTALGASVGYEPCVSGAEPASCASGAEPATCTSRTEHAPEIPCSESAPGMDLRVTPIPCIRKPSETPTCGESGTPPYLLDCGESGSTLRFLLPVVCALGVPAAFRTSGRLAERPMAALTDELNRHGCRISRSGSRYVAEGRLTAGEYVLPGDVSSQFVSGLLFALPLTDGDSRIRILGRAESVGYLRMTEATLVQFGIRAERTPDGYLVPGGQRYRTPGVLTAERDWSNAAAFLCMGALSRTGVTLTDMNADSVQGDRAVLSVLTRFGAEIRTDGERVSVRRGRLIGQTVDASDIPDLVPALAALAAGAAGKTVIENAGRLRFKESDRLKTTAALLRSLGTEVTETADGLVIVGRESLPGGLADASNDHRIAMAAGVAACICEGDVTVSGAECVNKSYPGFWEHYQRLEVRK